VNMEAIFETNPVFLSSLLGDLKTGRIQLPDFQRGWVWEDERIRGVLASVSRFYRTCRPSRLSACPLSEVLRDKICSRRAFRPVT
jgi:hypothetical protein